MGGAAIPSNAPDALWESNVWVLLIAIFAYDIRDSVYAISGTPPGMFRNPAEQLLAEHPPATTDDRDFLGAQYDLGLAWIHFPEGQGGLGLSPKLQSDVLRTVARAGSDACCSGTAALDLRRSRGACKREARHSVEVCTGSRHAAGARGRWSA